MNKEDMQQQRGLQQVLYKYLPEKWVDFYLKGLRQSLTAKVINWNSRKLDEINESRLLAAVSSLVRGFESKDGQQVQGFGPSITPDYYDILTPKCGNYADVLVEISPLTFVCRTCGKVHRLRSSSEYISNYSKRKCTRCDGQLKQLNFVFSCQCGWAQAVESIPCPTHKFEHLRYIDKEYKFICEVCGIKRDLTVYCKQCNEKLWPKNALDWEQYIPFTLNLIDLINRSEERFVEEVEDGSKLILAYWLGKIDGKQLKTYILKGFSHIDPEEMQKKIDDLKKKFIFYGLNEQQAADSAKMAVDSEYGFEELTQLLLEIRGKLVHSDLSYQKQLAVQILEYNTIRNAKITCSISEAMEIASQLNYNAEPEEFLSNSRKMGFSQVQASSEVPFIFSAYGYTRKLQSGSGVCLRSFPQERDEKKNIYATKLQTEGILFEFDRKMIIEWMIKNKFIENHLLPVDLNDEEELKLWFLNNINLDAISSFDEIDQFNDPITHYVYNLIHSVSHALIRQVSQLCGLDKNSLSEYLLPNIPAVFIYCQNSQGVNLGALFNVFQAYFDRWLKSTKSETEKCVFDPVCIDRDKACAGCLFLNEISCQHFNKDLNRRYLIGWLDKMNGKRYYGFWEDI